MTGTRRKVLFFDYWTRAVDRYIAPIASLLAEDGIDVELLHMGSSRGEPTSYRQLVLGVPSTDYTHFGRDIGKGIRHFAPDAVVVLNNAGLVDRLVHRICRRGGVPTLFLMHGIPAVDESRHAQVDNYRRHLSLRIRVKKSLQRLPEVRQYVRAIALDGDMTDRQTLRFLIDQAVAPERTWDFPREGSDLRSDHLLAWSRRHAKFYEEVFGYRPEQITVTGAPTHDEAVRYSSPASDAERAQLRASLGVPRHKPLCLIVLDALNVADGWTEQDIVDEVQAIASAAERAGAHTIVKPHPSAPGTPELWAAFAAGGSVTVTDEDVARLTAISSVVAGHVSSALAIAILLDKPLIIPRWGPAFRSYTYYFAEKAALPVESVAVLDDILPDLIAHGPRWTALHESVRAYRDDHITFTDGKSRQRVAARIAQVALAARTVTAA